MTDARIILGDPQRIHPEHRETVRDILVRLNASATPDDMDCRGSGCIGSAANMPVSGQ